MKRIILYIVILIAVLLIPVERADVADLRPVQTVFLYRDGGSVVLETDTGDKGQGSNSMQALADLKKTTPAIIYLDTAEYLLVAPQALEEVDALRTHLKATVELYGFQGELDPEQTSKYLRVHGSGPRLETWKQGVSLPMLEAVDGRIILS